MTDPTNEPPADEQDDRPDPVEDGPDDQADEQDDEPLGPAGQKALAAEKTRRREQSAKRRAAEERTAELEAELARLRTGDGDKDGIDVEAIRREAEQSARASANARVLRSEVKAAAAGRLADPGDALRFLDLDAIEVGPDGEIDEDEVADAIGDLLTRKPYLAAAPAAPRFQGGADQGARARVKAPTVDEQITAAEKSGDWATARRLKTAKLTETTTHQQ